MWKNYQHLKSGHWQKYVTSVVRTARTLCGNLRTFCYMRVTSRPITGRVRILVRILPVRHFAVHSSHITNRRKTLALRANMTGVGMKNSIQRGTFSVHGGRKVTPTDWWIQRIKIVSDYYYLEPETTWQLDIWDSGLYMATASAR